MSLLAASLGLIDLTEPLVDDKTDLDFTFGPDGGKLVLRIKPDGSVEYPNYLSGQELRKTANLMLKLDTGATIGLIAVSEIARLTARINELEKRLDASEGRQPKRN